MLINAQQISYQLPNRETLFHNIHFTLQPGDKAAIVGNNGAGKTTLLRIVAGLEQNFSGTLNRAGSLYYVPQHYGHFNNYTVAEALGIAPLLEALQAIEAGDLSQHYYDLLEHDWDIRARCEAAFVQWGLPGITPDMPLQALSGGMKTRLFLSGMAIVNPGIVLLDEPTNHLDMSGRAQLYQWMETTHCTLLLTSHDRELLRLCNPIWELGAGGLKTYGGNYDLYAEQKAVATAAMEQDLAHQEKALKEARRKQQQALERKQHADAQARKRARHSGGPKILLNSRKNSAENSSSRLNQVHHAKVRELRTNLQEAAALVQVQRVMKAYFSAPALPAGKVLAQATSINYAHEPGQWLWPQPLTLTIRSGDRLTIPGGNGSGKTTLLQLLRGQLIPGQGTIQSAPCTTLLLDQDYSLIDREKTVLEQAGSYNERHITAAALHTLLANFLFGPESWNKPCAILSGGEMLRLALCCMVLQQDAPDMIYLDEPTNNLDLANITMLGQIFADYRGTLVVISHDENFLEAVGIEDEYCLNRD